MAIFKLSVTLNEMKTVCVCVLSEKIINTHDHSKNDDQNDHRNQSKAMYLENYPMRIIIR